MMMGSLRERVGKLKELAGSLHIHGDTNEQSLLLAIIDTLDDFAEVIEKKSELIGRQLGLSVLVSQCPNCGESIQIDASSLRGDEPVVCENCHEIIGVISDCI